jgi:dTMP kinase
MSSAYPGTFVTIEGGEGAGKTGVTRAMAKAFKDAGRKVVLTREPGGCAEAELLRDLVVKGDAGRWAPMSELLLFLAARREHLDRVVIPALRDGAVVLCDRFSDSTVAYQGAKGIPTETILALNEVVCQGFSPDVTLLLDIDPRIGLERSMRRLVAASSGEDRFESLGIAYHDSIRASFLDAAKRNPERFVVIDASNEQELVIEKAVEEIGKRTGIL